MEDSPCNTLLNDEFSEFLRRLKRLAEDFEQSDYHPVDGLVLAIQFHSFIRAVNTHVASVQARALDQTIRELDSAKQPRKSSKTKSPINNRRKAPKKGR